MDGIFTRLVDRALSLTNDLVWFLNSLFHKVFNKCLIAKLFVNLTHINLGWQISMRCVFFCIANCMSSRLCAIFHTDVIPCLLKRIIWVVFRRLSWLFCGLCLFNWLLCKIWFWLFLDCFVLWYTWGVSIFYFSLLDIVVSDIVNCISFCKITSRSGSFNLARQKSVIEEIEPRWRGHFVFMQFRVEYTCKCWSRAACWKCGSANLDGKVLRCLWVLHKIRKRLQGIPFLRQRHYQIY